MNKNLLLGAVFISAFTTFFLVTTKLDPKELIISSINKFTEYSEYTLSYDMVLRFTIFGTEMDYLTTYTLSKSGDETAYDSYIIPPFSTGAVRSSMFIIGSGNYSCSTEYGISACYTLENSLFDMSDFEAIDKSTIDEVESVELIGQKLVNGVPCNNLKIILDESYYSDPNLEFSPELNTSVFTEITNLSMVLCVNEETGLTIESNIILIGKISEPDSQLSYTMEYNISQTLTDYSFITYPEAFILPFEIMSYEAYQDLVNQTLEYA